MCVCVCVYIYFFFFIRFFFFFKDNFSFSFEKNHFKTKINIIFLSLNNRTNIFYKKNHYFI